MLYPLKPLVVFVAEWHIGLSPWIIQDGNYGDFHVGQVADFALEVFGPSPLLPSELTEGRATLIEGCRYSVNAEVAYSGSDLAVLDFGVRAYSQHLRPTSRWVGGELSLGIDPYFYFEQLSKDSRVPPLIYAWKVTRILRDSAPYIEGVGPGGRKAWVWDEPKRVSEDVDHTDAWGEDRKRRATPGSPPTSGFAYTLICTNLDEPPARSMRPRA